MKFGTLREKRNTWILLLCVLFKMEFTFFFELLLRQEVDLFNQSEQICVDVGGACGAGSISPSDKVETWLIDPEHSLSPILVLSV